MAKFRSAFVFVLFSVVFCSLASAKDFKGIDVQPTKILLSEGRVLFTQIVAPAKTDGVTFLFMPGVNRSTLVEEEAVQILIKKGYGAVTYNFSTHPLSLALLNNGEEPYFLENELTLENFAEETEELAKILKKKFAMEKIIPVSLSYSGAVSVYLKDFPVVVETAPMTSNAATNPQMELFRQNLIASQFFNPIFGPGIVRATLDNLYRSNWSPQVAGISAQFGFEATDDMVEGYTMMSRAAEGFSWIDSDVAVQGRRVFVIAENESASLKENQLETYKTMKLGKAPIIVENSGHIIPFDQPSVFAEILETTAKETF